MDTTQIRTLALGAARYRSLRDTLWWPGDLNVIIGPNGSGKSNLLRALELLSASARGQLSEWVLQRGGVEALTWDGLDQNFGFSLFTREAPPPEEPGPLPIRAQAGGDTTPFLFYGLGINRARRAGQFEVNESLEQARSEVVLLEPIPSQLTQLGADWHRGLFGRLLLRDARLGDAILYDEEQKPHPARDLPAEETFLSQVQGPFVGNRHVAALRRYLAEWTIYHDLRVDQEAALRRPAAARYETRLQPDGQNLISVLHTHYTGDRDFKRDLDSAMRAAFGSDFEELLFPPASDQRIQLRVRWRSLRREASALELSDGTLRFLLLLTILRTPSPPPLIAIDEPETGLHPSMLPILAELAVDASRRTQVILTTHSAQFLDAFHATRPTTTVARWEEGATRLMVVDEDQLTHWLSEYTLGALFRSGELEGLP